LSMTVIPSMLLKAQTGIDLVELVRGRAGDGRMPAGPGALAARDGHEAGDGSLS
jgi:hypothetical protein